MNNTFPMMDATIVATWFIVGTCVDVFVTGTTHARVDGISQAADVRHLDPGPMSRPQGRHHVSHRLGQQVRPALISRTLIVECSDKFLGSCYLVNYLCLMKTEQNLRGK